MILDHHKDFIPVALECNDLSVNMDREIEDLPIDNSLFIDDDVHDKLPPAIMNVVLFLVSSFFFNKVEILVTCKL